MTDWNDKLALLLYGLSATALGTDPAADLPLVHDKLEPERRKALRERFEQALGWVRTATDRAPLPAPGAEKAPSADWLKAPELTHPISSSRLKLDPPQHPDRVRSGLAAALDELASRFSGDARKQALWLWRYGPEWLARADGSLGADWLRVPADGRSPHVSAWHQASMCAALAAAAPEPAVMTFELSVDIPSVGRSLVDLKAASAIHAHLCWQAARTLLEQFGPWSVLMPSLAWQPQVDRWLREQGVAEGDATAAADGLGFPSTLVALVPLPEVEQVGERLVQAARSAWAALAVPVREALGGAAAEAWDRQMQGALQTRWTAVPVEEDSTGAGALLPSRDIALYEKNLKQRREASGVDLGGKGVYLGLWIDAARGAADARRNSLGCAHEEPEPMCTACGAREVVGDGPAWKALRAGARWAALVDAGEALCGPCAVQRLGAAAAPDGAAIWSGLPDETEQPAAALMLCCDGLGAILRGGEGKESATLRSTLHTELPAQLLKARSRWRDVLDAPVLGGPCRSAAVAEALGAFCSGSAAALVAEAKGQLLAATGEDLTALLPRAGVLQVAGKLREALREPFVTLQAPGGVARRALHLGKAASSSVLIALGPREALPSVLRKYGCGLRREAAELAGRSALTLVVRTGTGRELVLAARWDEVLDSLQLLVQWLGSLAEPARVLGALEAVSVALTDTDLERSRNEPRLQLIRSILCAEVPEATEPERLARAILTLIDRNTATASDADASRGMDGVHIAGFLAQGVR